MDFPLRLMLMARRSYFLWTDICPRTPLTPIVAAHDATTSNSCLVCAWHEKDKNFHQQFAAGAADKILNRNYATGE